MATSDTHICNVALGLIGVGRIADINGVTSVERDCRSIFTDALKEVLEGYHWTFARKISVLAQLTDAPLFGFSYAYQLPADCVKPKGLSDSKMNFKIVGDTLHCNLEADVILEYTALITDASKYSGTFVTALSHRLAAQLAMMVKKDKKLSQETWDLYYALLPTLEADDGRSDFTEIEQSNPYVDARSF